MTTQTSEQFAQHMDGLARHSRWASRTRAAVKEYALPAELTAARKGHGHGVGPAVTPLQAWVKGMHQDILGFVEQNHAAFTHAVKHYSQTRSEAVFERALDTLAEDDKTQSTALIEKWKEAGKTLGHEYPEQQGLVLQTFRTTLNLFTGEVVGSLTQLMAEAVHDFSTWIKTADQSLADFFTALDKKLKNAFSAS